jgi:hypothetical protein
VLAPPSTALLVLGVAAIAPAVASGGCSVQVIDAHYAHLLPDSEEYLRGLLDDYDAATAASPLSR